MFASHAVYRLSVLMVSRIGHGAGVNNDDICLFTCFDPSVSLAEQLVHDGTGLGKVEFAAERMCRYPHYSNPSRPSHKTDSTALMQSSSG